MAKNTTKILCLHGYRQCAKKFNVQTGGVRKLLKSHADFTYVSAPHIIKDVEGEERGWWFSKTNHFSSKDETETDEGFDESLNFILKTFEESGPFDGILGFSQGAALAAILCAMKARNEINLDFKYVIIVSGFKSKCSKHLRYYSDMINIPSLHIIGETDEIVNKDVSEDLASLFVNPVIMRHNGGHHVPTSAAYKQGYRDFLTSQTLNDKGDSGRIGSHLN